MSTSGPSETVREPYDPDGGGAGPGIPRQRGIGPAPTGQPPPLPTGWVPPRGWPPPPDPVQPPARRWGLGAYLLVESVFLLASLLIVLPYVGLDGPPPAPVLLMSLTVPTILSAALALLITRLRGNGPRIDLGLRFTRADLLYGLAFGFGGLLLTIPAAAVWAQVVGPEQASSAVAELFAGQRFSVAVAVTVFLVVWLVAPICEEIVYRGLLWGAMERIGATRWWAFGLTTLVFAVAHFEFTRTPLLLVISIPIGLARLYTNRLGASIIAHQVNNLLPATALLLLLLGALPPQ